ncbi:hypothetical protein [Clostridium perfringens]|uniref:hypothetical protein n=1 Tax=Clostridium perfringens TaxID=1502 RepID=UPI000423C37D|nr:hypothetical protein [Clostridium perfringens]EJT6478468.1 hypothetical protein [Clostridium perfringens]
MNKKLQTVIGKKLEEYVRCWNCENEFIVNYKLTTQAITDGIDEFGNKITLSKDIVTLVMQCPECRKLSLNNFDIS